MSADAFEGDEATLGKIVAELHDGLDRAEAAHREAMIETRRAGDRLSEMRRLLRRLSQTAQRLPRADAATPEY
jgi:hypothetical protein